MTYEGTLQSVLSIKTFLVKFINYKSLDEKTYVHLTSSFVHAYVVSMLYGSYLLLRLGTYSFNKKWVLLSYDPKNKFHGCQKLPKALFIDGMNSKVQSGDNTLSSS